MMRRKKLLSLTVFLSMIMMLFGVSLTVKATENDQKASDATRSAGAKENQSVVGPFFTDSITKGNIVISTNEASPEGVQICPGNEGGKKCLGHLISGITGLSGSKPNTIVVEDGEHDIIFKDLEIYGGEYTDGNTTVGVDYKNVCAFEIKGKAAVNLTLKGENILVSGSTCAGIRVMEQKGETASLNISGEGSLVTKSTSGGAGIGADQYGSAGNITINSGNIKAIGAKRCAGIGGAAGKNGSGGTITITGGTVEAIGGNSDDRDVENAIPAGAGIGCGGGCTGVKGNVIISGGTVKAVGGENTFGGEAAGINCSILSSDGKSAVISTNGIYEGKGTDKTDTSKFNAMVWDLALKECTVYNDAIMRIYGENDSTEKDQLVIRSDQTITIPDKCSLVILEEDRYSLEGTIKGKGTIINKDYLRDGGGNAEGISKQKVSLTKQDIEVPKDLVYTSEELLDKFKINPVRKIYPDKNKPDFFIPVDIDHPELWTVTAFQGKGPDKEEVPFIDAGEYTVTFSRKGYPDIEFENIRIKPKEITKKMVKVDDQEYTGALIKPEVKITYDETGTGIPLTSPEDYIVAYGDEKTNVEVRKKTDANPPVVYISAKWEGNYIIGDSYTNRLPIEFSIVEDLIDDIDVSFVGEGITENTESGMYEAEYKRTAYEPKISLLPDMKEDRDYKISVSPGASDSKARTEAGVYTYTITGNGNYGGKKTVKFRIKQKELSIDEESLMVEPEKIYDAGSEIGLKNIELTGIAEGHMKEDIGIDLKATKGIIRNEDGTKAKDVGEYTKITLESLTLDGTQKDNYCITDEKRKQYENVPMTLKDNGKTLIKPAQADPPDLSGNPGDKDNKFTYELNIQERTDPIYEGLEYKYRYRMEKEDTEGSEGTDDWTYGTSNGISNLFENLDEGRYIFEACSLASNNVLESGFGGTTPRVITIGRLPAESTPEGFSLRISEIPNPDGETFTATLEPPESFDPLMAGSIKYCIAKAEDDESMLEYQDYKPIETFNPNRETECEAATEYVAYVRYKETYTRQESDYEESDLLKGETGTLTVKTPVISFYEDDSDEDNDCVIVGEHEYRGSAKVQINCGTTGARIFYTLDGTEPTEKSTPYEDKPILLERKFEDKETRQITVRAIAVKPKWNASNPEDSDAIVTFTRKLQEVEKPVLTISSDNKEEYTFTNSTTVTIECATEDAEIYYTTAENGEPEEPDPANKSQLYKESFKIRETTTVKAIACKKEMETSIMDPITITKLESAINRKHWTDPFARSGEETEKNTIAPLLMEKMEKELNTTSKEIISDEIGRLLYTELNVIGNNSVFVSGDKIDQVAYYDLVVKVKIDNGDWEDADSDDFPEEGLTVTVKYPEGTSMENNDFAVAHMFASGEEIGKVETREKKDITKTPDGLSFTLTSASPIAIAWTDAVPDGEFSNNVSTSNEEGEKPNDSDRPDDDNSGNLNNIDSDSNNDNNNAANSTGKEGDSGSGIVGGSTGAGSVSDAVKSALSTILPKTGDTNKIIAWIVVAVISVGVIIGVRMKSRKDKAKGNGKDKKDGKKTKK